MEYDFRGRSGSGSSGAPPAATAAAGSSLYPRIGQPSHGAATAPPRAAPYHHASASASPAPAAPSSSSSSSTSMGIQVVIKPEYRISPPPKLAPQMVEVPRNAFYFDFEYERKILAEAEKENPNWSKGLFGWRLEKVAWARHTSQAFDFGCLGPGCVAWQAFAWEASNQTGPKFVVESQLPPQIQPPRGPRHATPTTSVATPGDPVVDKYITMGLRREAVSFAVLNYGDNPVKVEEFVKSYNALHEMGFTSPNVPELLAIHDNDPDKVIQHLLSSS